jgi:hypothetical protein
MSKQNSTARQIVSRIRITSRTLLSLAFKSTEIRNKPLPSSLLQRRRIAPYMHARTAMDPAVTTGTGSPWAQSAPPPRPREDRAVSCKKLDKTGTNPSWFGGSMWWSVRAGMHPGPLLASVSQTKIPVKRTVHRHLRMLIRPHTFVAEARSTEGFILRAGGTGAAFTP